jgi:predicted anti-sigma-YlaC factor YlaD
MNCHAVRAVLDLHAEGRLTARRGTNVSAHLESCVECRKLAAPIAAPLKPAAKDFKSRLAASLKKPAQDSSAPAAHRELSLWPRDLAGVAWASAAVALVALAIGWSGVATQKDMAGDELAAGRLP